MKKITLLSILLGFAFISIAQPPQSFNYQAVVRDNSGELIQNQDVSFRISILDGSATGTVVYRETHPGHTNDFGLVSMKVGTGTVITGVFSNINWGNGAKYLKVEVDPAGGSSYTAMGTSEIVAVPYALHAGNAHWEKPGAHLYYNDGNVGIGTSNPEAKLHAESTISRGQLSTPNYGVYGLHTLYNSYGFIGSVNAGVFGFHPTSYGLKGTTESGYAVYGEVVDDGFGGYFEGKSYFENAVGIGTTDPSAELEVLGEVHAYSFYGDGSGLTGTGDNLGNHTATQNIKLSGKYLSGDGGNEGLFVTNEGKVGIGTSTPDDFLSVQGNISLSGAEGAFLRFRQANDMRWSFLYRSWTPSTFCLWDEVEGKLVMGFKQETGHVGIGCNASNMLDVQGAGTESFGVTGFNEVVGHFKSTGSGHSAVSIDANADRDAIVYLAENGNPMWSIRTDASDSDNSLEIREHKDGLNQTAIKLRNFSVKYVLHLDGDIWPESTGHFYLGQPAYSWLNIYSKDYTTVSSKSQLLSSSEIKSGLNKILLIKPLEMMQSTSTASEAFFGLDPQALYSVLPEAVSIDEKTEENWGIKYNQLIPVLIRAIQEQQEQIEALESRLESLIK